MTDKSTENSTAQQSVSTDALPISARHSLIHSIDSQMSGQNNNESMSTGSDLPPTESFGYLPEPPTDWHFNVFLQQLADSLSIEDLNSMKGFFHGDGGIGRGVLDKMKTPIDFFRILRTRGYINRDNLLYLQGMLFLAGRKDLVKMAVEHSKGIGNVLHFYAPLDQQENGYKDVKFHIDGKDFRNYSRVDIEKLRNIVATVLCVPRTFIFIRGIEPSSSLVVTLMIPEMYVDILQELLEEGEDFVDLHDIGVDTVELDGQTSYNITGSGQTLIVETEQQAKLVNVYEQLKLTKVRLDKSEEAYIDISRQVDLLQSQLKAAEENFRITESQLNTMKAVLSKTTDELHPATLKELTSLKEFTEALHQINLESVDRKVIQRVLNATVNIVSTRVKENHRIQEQRMLLDLQEMQSKLIPLMFELERSKVLTNISNMDKAMLDNLQFLFQSLIAPAQVSQKVSLTQHGLQMMKKISSKLRHKEKEKLKQKYQWVSDGKIEKFMKEDQNLLLAGLYYKEIEERQVFVSPESFVAQCLTEVGREELKKFLDQKPTANPSSPRYHAEARQKQEGAYSQQGQQQRSSWQQPRQEQTQGQQHQQQQHDQTVLITRMAQQIQEMYNMLQTKQGAYDSKYEAWKTPSYPFDPQFYQENQAL